MATGETITAGSGTDLDALPSRVTERAQAQALLAAIGAGVASAELARFVRAMTEYDHAQTFAIMRGSGNEMDLCGQLLALLRDAGLASRDEVIAALTSRVAIGRGDAA